MAEIVLKINEGSGYDDGDVLCCFNNRHIAHCHAQHLCHIKTIDFNGDGLRETDSLPFEYLEKTYQYKFIRTGPKTIQRIELATETIEEFGEGEINVELFLRRRTASDKHLIFGEAGSEIWFGGRVDVSQATVDSIWDSIEERTSERRNATKFEKFPAGRQELKSHLFVGVNNFTDEKGNTMVESEFGDPDEEGNREILQKRKTNIIWRDLSGINTTRIRDIENRNVTVDLRDNLSFMRNSVVRGKPSRRGL